MCKATAQVAHECLAEFYQTGRDPALVHQFACEHEERNRHERKTVHAVVDVTVEQRDVAFLAIQPKQDAGSSQQAEKDR